jgi:hypothetical protein
LIRKTARRFDVQAFHFEEVEMRSMGDRIDSGADALAIEHCLWAASQGLGPCDVIASIGGDPSDVPSATWHDAQLALSLVWEGLRRDAIR